MLETSEPGIVRIHASFRCKFRSDELNPRIVGAVRYIKRSTSIVGVKTLAMANSHVNNIYKLNFYKAKCCNGSTIGSRNP